MILFDGDYQAQECYFDFSTKNHTFLKMAKLLKDMGIKNNKFMLTIYDKDLIGVDPFHLSDNSLMWRVKVATEAHKNFWYFLRECVRVPQQGGLEPGIYELNRSNLALCWCFFNNIATFITIPRQCGKSYGAIVLFTYLFSIRAKRLALGLMAKDNNLVQDNVMRLKTIIDGLPEYLVFKQTKDTDNKEGMDYKVLQTAYKTRVPQQSRDSAEGLGRGATLGGLHWDELPWFRFNYLTYPAALSARSKAQETARSYGIRIADIITTTAAKRTTKEGAFAYGIKRRALRFTEEFYDCKDIEALMGILSVNSKNKMMYLEFNHTQIGKDDAWLEARRAEAEDEEVFRMDYLNEWLFGGGIPIIPQNVIDTMKANVKSPVHISMYESLVHRWYRDYETMDRGFPWVLGCDTADNIGRDFTTFVFTDPRDLSVAMTTRCNVTNLMYIAMFVVKFMEEWPGTIFIPERNKNGAFLLDILLGVIKKKSRGAINPFKRIYNRIVEEWDSWEQSSSVDLYTTDPTNDTIRKNFGFWTSGGKNGTRAFLFKNVLNAAVPRAADKLYDKDIIDEGISLSLDSKTGRIDHSEGNHDDTFMAWLLCAFFILFAKNKQFYGLTDDIVLTQLNNGKWVSDEEKQRHVSILKTVAVLREKVNGNELSDSLKQELKYELNKLEKLVPDSMLDSNIISPDQRSATELLIRKDNEQENIFVDTQSADLFGDTYYQMENDTGRSILESMSFI